MRKLLNTLYVTTPEAYLAKDGLNVVVSVDRDELFRIPIMNIEGIVTFGYMGASPGLMKLCMDNNVSLVFMSPHGRFIGRVQGVTKGNVLLRKKIWIIDGYFVSLRKKCAAMKILAINPGMISTKVGIFSDEELLMHATLNHPFEELCRYPFIMDEFDYRKEKVMEELHRQGYDMDFDVVVGRGGLVKPIESGVYELNDKVIADTQHPRLHHACNLGALMALSIAGEIEGCRAFIVDPGVVDELDDVARITGLPELPHQTIWHALNQREIAKRYCREHGVKYEEQDLIVCHMGSGISFAMHHHGRAIECSDALSGDGPFSPSRAGMLPTVGLVKLCYSGQYTEAEMLRKINGHSGLTAHLGTNDVREVERRIAEGDEKAKLVLDAMIYSVARWMASLAPATNGHVDAVILTGAIANSQYVTDGLRRRLSFLAPIFVYPGEDELTALAMNVLRAMRGEQEIKVYS